MPDWFIEDGRSERGPYTATDLKRIAAAGGIDATTPIRRDDLSSPVPAARVRGLLPAVGSLAARAEAATARADSAPRPDAPSVSARPTPPPSLKAEEPMSDGLAAAVGVAPGAALFSGDTGASASPRSATTEASAVGDATAAPASSAAPPFNPYAGRRIRRDGARPMAPAPRPRGVPLEQPVWWRLWPLAALTVGLGWIGGGLIDLGRVFPHGAVWPVLVLALASVPLAWICFLGWLRPRRAAIGSTCGVAGFTAIGGLISLLGLQWVAFNSLGVRTYGRLGLLKLVLMLIAVAYALTASPHIALRFVGFVFGVGLLEEMTKLLPLAWLIHQSIHRRLGLHGFIALGFASGLGFGIGEALFQYNPWSGVVGFGSNLVRWCACVPSHGVYTAISAVFLWKLGDRIAHAEGFWGKAAVLSLAAGAMALLHGAYDTVCSIGPVPALLVEAASLPLLAWIVARATVGEEDPPETAVEPRAILLRRPAVLGGAFASLALAVMLAALGSGAKPVVTLAPWTHAYAHGRVIAPESSAPLEARFTLGAADEAGETHLVGEWRNTAGQPLAHVVLRVHGDDDEQTSIALEPFDLAAGASHRVQPDEWPFDPGEIVEATWRGQRAPVVFRIPTEEPAATKAGDQEQAR